MQPSLQRTHDKDLYLTENRYGNPKELSKRTFELLRQGGPPQPGETAADIGCAAGEFLYSAVREYPSVRWTGYDVVPELLAKAKKWVPQCEFKAGSVLDSELIASESLDFLFMSGVHSIFDSIEPILQNVVSWLRPGGRAYISGLFNPHPVDVWIQYRRPEQPKSVREVGWNIFSMETVEKILKQNLSVQTFRFEKFEMPFPLDPVVGDPLRTWTFEDKEGHLLLTNGLQILCPMQILEIRTHKTQ